jgi:predicted transcriptional regulator
MNNEKPYKPVKDYAREKGLTVQAVYQAIKRGSLESKKIGTYTLVR